MPPPPTPPPSPPKPRAHFLQAPTPVRAHGRSPHAAQRGSSGAPPPRPPRAPRWRGVRSARSLTPGRHSRARVRAGNAPNPNPNIWPCDSTHAVLYSNTYSISNPIYVKPHRRARAPSGERSRCFQTGVPLAGPVCARACRAVGARVGVGACVGCGCRRGCELVDVRGGVRARGATRPQHRSVGGVPLPSRGSTSQPTNQSWPLLAWRRPGQRCWQRGRARTGPRCGCAYGGYACTRACATWGAAEALRRAGGPSAAAAARDGARSGAAAACARSVRGSELAAATAAARAAARARGGGARWRCAHACARRTRACAGMRGAARLA